MIYVTIVTYLCFLCDWSNGLRLHYHLWMLIMQLGQPQPAFAGCSLSVVRQVVHLCIVRYQVSKLNRLDTT